MVLPSASACATMTASKRSISSSPRSSSSGVSLARGCAAPIEQPRAACPPRRRMLPWPPCGLSLIGVGWAGSSGYLRKGHRPPRLPRLCRLAAGGFRKGSTPAVLSGTSSRAAALEDLRQAWTPPPVDDAAWEGHLRWMALRDSRCCREWLLPHEKRLSTSKQYRLISERAKNRFLDRHPDYLEAARREAEEAGGLRCGS